MAVFRNQMMPMQPQGGGISNLFGGFIRPMFPPMGISGGFGGGRFGPPPFNPAMLGGGFFGGFRPRLRRRRRPRPQMPDYSKQFSSLEAKIAELQKQLADRQAARQAATPMSDPVMDTPMSDPVMDMPMPLNIPAGLGAIGPGGAGQANIPQIDPVALKELQDRIAANLNIDVGGEGGRPDMPINIPTPPPKILDRGPGPARIPVKPPSIARLPKEFIEERMMPPLRQVPDVMPAPVMPAPMPAPVMPAPMPAPVMPEPMPVMQAPALPEINIPNLNLTKINLPKPKLGGIRGIMKPRLQSMAGMGPAQIGARIR